MYGGGKDKLKWKEPRDIWPLHHKMTGLPKYGVKICLKLSII
jgi:hypothetical protein